MSYLPLGKIKRQRVLSACKRCRDRKLGCDSHRPCELCKRAGVECVSRDEPPVVGPSLAGQNLGGGSLAGGSLAGGSLAGGSLAGASLAGGGNLPREPTYSPVVLPESTIVDLSTLIFRGSGPAPTTNHDSSALPGGRKLNELASADGARKWRDLAGVPLPPDSELEELVNRYFVSVDWFMMVFHEDAFKRRFKDLLGKPRIAYRDTNFSWLCLLVVALGAHYSLPTPRRHGIDYRQLSRDLIAAIEARFLQIVGCATLETVQICILLGSFFLFNARPNAGLGVSASGVKIAQVIGLHRESLWKETSSIVREERRRTWWTLEVFDKYAAVLFGRPCIIDDSDCDVGMVSHVSLDGQSVAFNPLLLYHQWKFRLYRIVDAFLGRRKQGRQPDTIQTIHQQMLQWRNELPEELRLATYSSETGKALLPQVQALNLQLTYDNLHIILHRTAAFEHDLTESRLTVTETGSSSLQQLFDSAMETSKLYKYSAVLEATRRTHAEMHIGITLFTAGVVLCAICLFRPLTEMGYRAKTGVMHIIRMCRSAETSPASGQHLISRQSLGILESLALVVLQREADLIIGKNDRPAAGGLSQQPSGMPTPVASSSDAATVETAAAIPAPVVTSDSGEKLLHPIQEVFAQHFSGSAPQTHSPVRPGQRPMSLSETPTPSGPEVANVFDWDGNLSTLVDQGLADASQLWLWADNLGYDTFNDQHLE